MSIWKERVVNLYPNPSAEIDTASITAINCTATRSKEFAKYGHACFKLTCTTAGTITITNITNKFPVNPNKLYAAAFWVRPGAVERPITINLNFYTAAGSFIGGIGSSAGTERIGDWVRFMRLPNATDFPGANAALATIVASIDNCLVGEVHYIDGFMACESLPAPKQTTIEDYFDGDSPWAHWVGTRHNSASDSVTLTVGAEFKEQLQPLKDALGANPQLDVFVDALGLAMQPIDDLSKDAGGPLGILTPLLVNKIPNPSFEAADITTTWAPYQDVGTATIARSTNLARSGIYSCLIQATSVINNAGVVLQLGRGIPISPGQTLTTFSYSRAGQVQTRNFQMLIAWWGANDVFLSSVAGSLVANSQSAFIKAPTLSGVAPAGTVKATVYTSIVAPAVGESHYVDDFIAIIGGKTPVGYFDGDAIDTAWGDAVDNAWLGTPHDSPSTLYRIEAADQPGWSQVLDLNRAKNSWLRWLGQMPGYYVPTNPQSFESERARITSRSAHRRGSIAMLREAVQEHLKGNKTVTITERAGGAPGAITVNVLTAEIATTFTKLQAAANAQKAAGLVLTVTQT